MPKWIAICTHDYNVTQFNLVVEAETYTKALIEATSDLRKAQNFSENASAVIELYEK